jgi:Galactose-3-O-sulfotransferase
VLSFLVLQVSYFSLRTVVQPIFRGKCDLEHPVSVSARVYESRYLSCNSSGDGNWAKFQNEPSTTGLMYMSLIHSDDDVVGSVALQIAQPPSCNVRMGVVTKTAHMMHFRQRNRKESFLFSFLRLPTERAIRDFFHHMTTLRKYEPSDPTFQAYLEERGYVDLNLQELALQEYSPNNGTHQDSVIQSIVRGYDFLGISERRDESLVVLKLLLDLPTSKILYLENPTPFVYEDDRCFMVVQPFVSPTMRTYFSSDSWHNRIKQDLLLYQTANRSLDMTIDQLGRTAVENELRHFRWALQYAKEVCLTKVKFLCNYDGIWQRGAHTCRHDRYGCASQCLNSREVIERVDT